MTMLKRLNRQSKKYYATIGIFLTLIIGLIDFRTGFELRMEIFYLVPISFLTWFVNKRAGIGASVLALISIVWTDAMAGKTYHNIPVEIWNMAMYFVFFAVVTILINNLRVAQRQRESLITELQKALSEVKELSGILPICANCKKIRDDEGYWQDVAVYISKKTHAEFTHSLCKECAMKLYPEFIKKEGK